MIPENCLSVKKFLVWRTDLGPVSCFMKFCPQVGEANPDCRNKKGLEKIPRPTTRVYALVVHRRSLIPGILDSTSAVLSTAVGQKVHRKKVHWKGNGYFGSFWASVHTHWNHIAVEETLRQVKWDNFVIMTCLMAINTTGPGSAHHLIRLQKEENLWEAYQPQAIL